VRPADRSVADTGGPLSFNPPQEGIPMKVELTERQINAAEKMRKKVAEDDGFSRAITIVASAGAEQTRREFDLPETPETYRAMARAVRRAAEMLESFSDTLFSA
jgi:hypothetical protein